MQKAMLTEKLSLQSTLNTQFKKWNVVVATSFCKEAFALAGTGNLVIDDGNMDAVKYKEILDEYWSEAVENLGLWLENNPKHRPN